MAACRVHGNVELGERVRRHLLEVKPDHSSDYVLLANMHAGTGQMNYMMEGRKLMQDRGIQKQKAWKQFYWAPPRLKPRPRIVPTPEEESDLNWRSSTNLLCTFPIYENGERNFMTIISCYSSQSVN
ncbi:Hypothetical predicted protein [Olea europaea subsp. europaea]|uniref:Pentatricopeptide repeat-containing protein n=1 Tax=Olea europaea subsp. europaea TaxID=158383 RepID=A0A8S0QAF7_OLEEU|nr:Hypothetical predicted protein [Olea europaea subsp. europaea]